MSLSLPKYDCFVIYVTEQGGMFKVVKATSEQYEKAISSGQWDESPVDWDPPVTGRDMVDLVWIAKLTVESDFDFVLGRPRALASP
jgi:hypothetical protein